jgi:mxaJ protein
VLRVCSDPNNLPYSNAAKQGFENRLAELLARELGDTAVAYTWWAQRRGFVRNTLNAGQCDVIIGMPSRSELAAVTRPYYRSTYVFVSRRGGLRVRSLDDASLRTARVGVQVVAADYGGTPPSIALANRGIVRNVRGYIVTGDYREPNPPARIVDAVAHGEVDVAIAWGPLAGYFAPRAATPLVLAPVSPQIDQPALPFAFDISMGVRRSDRSLRDSIDDVLVRRRATIDSILARYGVPRADHRRTDHASPAGSPE